MANNIWKILGIDPTKDISLIKKAYTNLVRAKNPEEDPEGFQQLHSAYKAALFYAKASARADKVLKERPETSHNDAMIPDEREDGDPDEAEVDEENKGSSAEHFQDPYDFSMIKESEITYDNINLMLERLDYFRSINKADSCQNLIQMDIRNSKALVRNLYICYRTLYSVTRDTGYLRLFFDEPAVSLYSASRGFRSWIEKEFSSPHDKDILPIVKEYAAAYSKAPSYYSWRNLTGERTRRLIRILGRIILLMVAILVLLMIYRQMHL